MKNRTVKIAVWALVLAIVAVTLLAVGVAYSLYAWLRVDPVPVSAEAGEEERLEAVNRWLGSVSKQFTAAGMLRLAETGALDIDDAVAAPGRFPE